MRRHALATIKNPPGIASGGFFVGHAQLVLSEEYLRRALLLSRGDATAFLTRPLSATMLAIALVAMVIVLLPAIRTTREVAFKEEG